MKRFLLIPLICAGCSAQNRVDTPSAAPVEYVDLFMRRASASESEFEQYKISPGGVFLECGEFIRGRPEPQNQRFIPSDKIDLTEVREKAATVSRVVGGNNSGLPSPGKGDSMFDPGQFVLSIGEGGVTLDLKTSINAVSDATDPTLKAMKSLAVAVRRALKTDNCGKDDFYGIPGSS